MKRLMRLVAATLCAGMVLSCGLFAGIPVVNAAGVTIDETNFPDKYFREYVEKNCDTSGDGILSQNEINAVDRIEWYSGDMQSLKGIEFFMSLTELTCVGSKLTSLDLSKNTELLTLYCSNNQLTSLDISQNTKLGIVDCSNNQLTSLDVSKNSSLFELICYNNPMKELDISKNTNMVALFCSGCPITSIDISNNESLIYCCTECEPQNEITLGRGRWHFVDVVAWVELYSNGGVMAGLVIEPTTAIYNEAEQLYKPAVTPTPVPTQAPTSTPAPTVSPTATTAPEQSVGSFVDRCYEVALGRAADDEGFKYWLDALNSGKICGAQAGYGFIFSGEYINKNRTNEEFVTDLYSMYFGRTPDEGGFNYWVGLLNSGVDREEIFAGFANSAEFDNLCGEYGVVTGTYIVGVPNDQQGGVNSFVARLYQVCLNRLPDMGGQAGWVEKLIKGEVTGTSCSYGFVFSPEFIGKEPSNEEFVNYMYAAFFGREADEAGFNAWVSTLNGGGSYEEVFNGFTGSAEFANLCASYGINP